MKQLDPKAVWLFFISFILQSIIPIIFLTFWVGAFVSGLNDSTGSEIEINSTPSGWVWVVGPAFFIILCFVWAKLTYRFYRYELLENGFRKESGVIYKKYVTIPYDRIQNVDINRGILARIFGLSDLHIQTAGASATVSRYGVMGSGAEGRLPGVSYEDAEKLRDELINRARQPRSQGL